jgi:hypothetical protein
MEPISILDPEATLDDVESGELLVHAWRVEQLRRLGVRRASAETFAARVDWHEIADLVHHGCPPNLALEIVR